MSSYYRIFIKTKQGNTILKEVLEDNYTPEVLDQIHRNGGEIIRTQYVCDYDVLKNAMHADYIFEPIDYELKARLNKHYEECNRQFNEIRGDLDLKEYILANIRYLEATAQANEEETCIEIEQYEAYKERMDVCAQQYARDNRFPYYVAWGCEDYPEETKEDSQEVWQWYAEIEEELKQHELKLKINEVRKKKYLEHLDELIAIAGLDEPEESELSPLEETILEECDKACDLFEKLNFSDQTIYKVEGDNGWTFMYSEVADALEDKYPELFLELVRYIQSDEYIGKMYKIMVGCDKDKE